MDNDTGPPMRADARLLVAGTWVNGCNRAPIIDKFTLSTCGYFQVPSREQVKVTVAAADRAFRDNRMSGYERGKILDTAAELLGERLHEFITALRLEAGFTAADVRGELNRSMQTLRLSAEEARRFCGEIVPLDGSPQQNGRLGFTLRVPLGVICAITPFNAPLNTVAHKVAPALAAGNAIVLKPSSHTPTVANLLVEVLVAAGLPPGLISVLHGGSEVVQWLLDEPAIKFYAFTGSTEVGRAIQERAGLRRTQMELGSIAFTILCDDADLDVALPKIVTSGYRKAGQVCTSVQILLVHQSIYGQVETGLAELVRNLPYGNPADERTIVGPVISEAAAERIESWINAAVAQGAQRLVGGSRTNAVIPPTLLANVSDRMEISCQEVFGPVVSVVPFDTLDEAIARVNASRYGLATGIFTNRLDDAFKAARRLQVGGVHVNETSSSRVDVMPYGGTKDSGFGREGPHYAIREMSEERIVTIVTTRT